MVPRSGCVTGFDRSAGLTERISATFQARKADNAASASWASLAGIAFRPAILIEGLDNVMILGQGLAEAEGEGYLSVGKMRNNIASAPFAGRRRLFQTVRADGLHQLR